LNAADHPLLEPEVQASGRGYERFNNIFHTTIVDGTAVVDFSGGFLSCR
jgi:hypothetical protein